MTLSDQERHFAQLVVGECNTIQEAAKLAGYTDPDKAAKQLIRQKPILQAIKAAQTAFLDASAKPLAIQALAQILTNTKSTNNDKIKAAKTILDYDLSALSLNVRQQQEDYSDAQAIEDKRKEDQSIDTLLARVEAEDQGDIE